MTSEEKMVIDTLASMSRSMSKIAAELAAIRETLHADRKNILRESRAANRNDGSKTARQPVTRQEALSHIRDIRRGSYLK